MIDLPRRVLLETNPLNGEQLLRNETMKRNPVTLAVLLAALSFFAAPSASAISQQDIQAIKKEVASVPAAETAAKAAQIVSQAAQADRQDVALATIREIISNKPGTLLAVVAAIAKAAPETSAAVAAEAAKLVRDQSAEIAKAAASGAPDHAQEIAAAVAKASPNRATQVARSVSTSVPDQTSLIVEKVIASVPESRTSISKDATLTRLSQRSSATTGGTGIITTRPGTIRGTPVPNLPPEDTGNPTEGSDPRRRYGTP